MTFVLRRKAFVNTIANFIHALQAVKPIHDKCLRRSFSTLFGKIENMKRDLSISLFDANLYGLLVPLPIIALFATLYIARWGLVTFTFDLLNVFASPSLFVLAFIVGIVLHELIHGVTWMIAGRKSWRTIKMGIMWWALTPYAHSLEPLAINAYRVGVVMPAILLGILPSLFAVVIGSGWWLAFGIVFTLAAGGDMIVLWLVRNVERGKLVEDHPSRCGCYVIE